MLLVESQAGSSSSAPIVAAHRIECAAGSYDCEYTVLLGKETEDLYDTGSC